LKSTWRATRGFLHRELPRLQLPSQDEADAQAPQSYNFRPFASVLLEVFHKVGSWSELLAQLLSFVGVSRGRVGTCFIHENFHF